MKQNCNVPAFLTKLWTLVEDHSTDDLICWSEDGCSFVVREEQNFSRKILPLHFKHSNMSSFVRQLNMYGFHKVVQVARGDRWKDSVAFQHPHFRQTQPHLLEFIRRKVSVSRGGEEGVPQVLLELGQVRGWQDMSDSKLLALHRENESLWREVDTLKEKSQQHHRIIRKIIRFIASTVQSKGIAGLKRKLPLMIDGSGMSPSPPKYSRSFSMQDSKGVSTLHGTPLDFTAGAIYHDGTSISDVTDLLDVLTGAQDGGRTSQANGASEGAFDPTLSSPPIDELDPSLLEDHVSLETAENGTDSGWRREACDPLALMDPSLTPCPGQDLLTELFKSVNPVLSSQAESLEGRPGTGDWAGRVKLCQTVATFDRGSQRRDQGEEEEHDEGWDILPCLFQLAQEASGFTCRPAGLLSEMVPLL